MPPPLLLLLVQLLLRLRLLGVRAQLTGLLFDYGTVCEPNFRVCPNNGLSFRERDHDCQFSPCQFIPPGPTPPPPVDPKTLGVTKWFGKREFVVPVLDTAAITRGQRMEQSWTDALVRKRALSSSETTVPDFHATIDLYIVPTPVEVPRTVVSPIHAQQLHVQALLLSEIGLVSAQPSTTAPPPPPPTPSPTSPYAMTSKPTPSPTPPPVDRKHDTTPAIEPELAVLQLPWTRWEFFGQMASGLVTVEAVHAALQLLRSQIQNKTSTTSDANTPPQMRAFTTLVVQVADELRVESDPQAMTQLLLQCHKLTRDWAFYSKPRTTAVRVFTTDFRQRGDGDQEATAPWNMTRIECEQDASAGDTGGSGSGSSQPVMVVLRPDAGSSFAMDGSGKDQETDLRGCSCWSRSRVNENDGDDDDHDNTTDKTTTWVLCP